MLGSKATWRGNELLGLQAQVYHKEKPRFTLEAGTEVKKEFLKGILLTCFLPVV